jgi:hypothetical protein
MVVEVVGGGSVVEAVGVVLVVVDALEFDGGEADGLFDEHPARTAESDRHAAVITTNRTPGPVPR